MSEYRNPALTVDAVICHEGKVLFIKRLNEPYRDCWAFPGGFVEYGECVEDACIREAKEETGLDIELTGLVGVYSDPERDPRGHTVSIAFSARVVGGTLRSDSDARDARFFDIDCAGDLNLAFDHELILEDSGIL